MSGWNIFLLLITTPRWYKVCGRLLVKSESDQTRLYNRYLMLHHSTPHNITEYESRVRIMCPAGVTLHSVACCFSGISL